METVNPSRGGMFSAAVTLRERGRVLLQEYDEIPPVMRVKMVPEPVPSPKGPQVARKRGMVTVL